MCPDQLFTALSAWYMCAISFNRWYSVCRPSSYFFRTSLNSSRTTATRINHNRNQGNSQKQMNNSTNTNMSSSSWISFITRFDFCFCLTRSHKYRQHIQAFRSIAIITLLGILCLIYPIFMHELRPVMPSNEHVFESNQKLSKTSMTNWKRCYHSQKHEYAYDIIGIILSCLLHILPLTFVAGMSLMIIVRLKQRQRLMLTRRDPLQSSLPINNRPISYNSMEKTSRLKLYCAFQKKHVHYEIEQAKIIDVPCQSLIPINPTCQGTVTEQPMALTELRTASTAMKCNTGILKRHHSRDRTITIMLVSIAMSYLMLTLPYRLFWSYNVYTKRVHPERLKSSSYLSKMHYIDHFLRTVRNIHYGTNFISFIFLSKAFRRQFRQLCLDRFVHLFHCLCPRKMNKTIVISKDKQLERVVSMKIPDNNVEHEQLIAIDVEQIIDLDGEQRDIANETSSLIGDARMQEKDGIRSIVEFDDDDLSLDDDEQ
jgi:hypothetical protein